MEPEVAIGEVAEAGDDPFFGPWIIGVRICKLDFLGSRGEEQGVECLNLGERLSEFLQNADSTITIKFPEGLYAVDRIEQIVQA
jgi:hypothetical protein